MFTVQQHPEFEVEVVEPLPDGLVEDVVRQAIAMIDGGPGLPEAGLEDNLLEITGTAYQVSDAGAQYWKVDPGSKMRRVRIRIEPAA